MHSVYEQKIENFAKHEVTNAAILVWCDKEGMETRVLKTNIVEQQLK